MAANPARGQLNREDAFFPVPARSRLIIWLRETGSAVPSRVSLLILYTQSKSDAFTHGTPLAFFGDVHLFVPSTVIGSARVHRVTQLRTDGVHCRECGDQ